MTYAKLIGLAAVLFGMSTGIVTGTIWTVDRFATKQALAALEVELIAEIDARSIGTIINAIKLAKAQRNKQLLEDLCVEYTAATQGQIYPGCPK